MKKISTLVIAELLLIILRWMTGSHILYISYRYIFPCLDIVGDTSSLVWI